MDNREGFVRELLVPVRENLVNAAFVMAYRQNAAGHLTPWESFALTLCLAMREVVDIAMEDGDVDGKRDIVAMIRVADDAIFAVRWPAEDWWPYLARTKNGRDTLSLVRHVESEIAQGTMTGLVIFDDFSEAVLVGERLMENWKLDQMLPPCVGNAMRTSM